MTPRFEAEPILRGLTGFQRDTVDHIVERFYGSDPTKRFLTADETGLGKSIVARGVIASVIERLQDDDDVERIDIIYVCSNADIARQNLKRLNVTNKKLVNVARRLSLLALDAPRLQAEPTVARKGVNLVAFTPGTSFSVGHATGMAPERALLHVILTEALDLDQAAARHCLRLLRANAGEESFSRTIEVVRWQLGDDGPDPTITETFLAEARSRGLLGRWQALVDDQRGRRRVADDDRERANVLIGELRGLLSRAGVETLSPDLVILDEFQRFQELLDPTTGAAAELADELFRHPDARVLLLSATPYKPFTLAEETLAGDDHAAQFAATLSFLADDHPEDVEHVRQLLRSFRAAVVAGTDPEPITAALRELLLRYLTRVERPQSTTRAMSIDRTTTADGIEPDDLVGFAALDQLARAVDAPMTLEYWKSAPFFVNFLEGYRFGDRLRDDLKDPRRAAELKPLVRVTPRLDRDAIEAHRPLDLGNAKLRRLAAETVEAGWWKLLWLPPSLPYTDPGGAYAELDDVPVEKRLVFSSWAATPTAIAGLLSHQASAKVHGGTHLSDDGTWRPITARLNYTVTDRLTGMPTIALFFPNPALAAATDPLRLLDGDDPIPATQLATRARRVVAELVGPDGDRPTDADVGYWAAAFGLAGSIPGALVDAPGALSSALMEGDEESTGLRTHVDRVVELHRHAATIGVDAPPDLQETIAAIGLHAPANIAWRALARQVRPDDAVTAAGLWRAAATVATGFRSLFNRAETMALLDHLGGGHSSYWRAVLAYCADGNLQSVLDEHLHMARSNVGDRPLDDDGLFEIARTLGRTLAMRPSTYSAFDPLRPDDPIHLTSRFALRYTNRRGDEANDGRRLSDVRAAFNSPFWPFVLATTSVGQEGVDFHWWCHAILHWNTPANPVDFEQREGRVHRYGGLAIRRNLADRFGKHMRNTTGRDPWTAGYAIAEDAHPDLGELAPHWVLPGATNVERHLSPYPLSSDVSRLERLKADVALYRLTFGQPRQEDLLDLLRRHGRDVDDADTAEIDALRIDLHPPQRHERRRTTRDDLGIDLRPLLTVLPSQSLR